MGYDSEPPSRRRHSFGGTCSTPTLCTETFPSIHIPLGLTSTVTFILFVLMCHLSTPHTLQRLSIYHPSIFAHLGGTDVDLDTGVIFADRLQSLGLDQSRHAGPSHEQVLSPAPGKSNVPTIHPDIMLVETTETEKKSLWFRAEYSIEIPLCDLEGNSGEVQNCPQDMGMEVKIPASEFLRVSFCSGFDFRKHIKLAGGGEQYGMNNRGGGGVWEDNQTWDYVFPPIGGSRDVDTASHWLWNVGERPLKRWITVNVPGGSHNTSLRTQMAFPTHSDAGTKPQWQFLLTIAGVSISADALEVLDEEIFVDHAIELPMTWDVPQKTSPPASGPVTEVMNMRVKMWRWKGTFGGCPGEGKRSQVVLLQPGDDKYVG